jgi:hypothetical protein
MIHAGHEIELDAVVGLTLPDLLHDALVIAHRVLVRDQPVGRTVISDQLAAAADERRQIRIHGLRCAVVDGLGAREIAVDVERRRIPARIVRDDVAEVVRTNCELRRRVRGPERLAAGARARHDDFTVAVDDTRIDSLRGFDLGGAQALTRRTGRALQARGIEIARGEVRDHAVLDAVLGIASRDSGLLEQPELVGGESARSHVPLNRDAEQHQRRPIAGRRAGHDAVVVLGIALCFLQALAPTRRATEPVRSIGRPAVARCRERLAGDGQLVHGAILVIDELLRLADGPREVAAPALMTRVGVGDGVPAQQRIDQRVVDDRAGGTAVAGLHELAVPILGQPELEPDVRSGRRPDRARDAAERRQRREVPGRPERRRRRRAELTRRHRFRYRDDSLRPPPTSSQRTRIRRPSGPARTRQRPPPSARPTTLRTIVTLELVAFRCARMCGSLRYCGSMTPSMVPKSKLLTHDSRSGTAPFN